MRKAVELGLLIPVMRRRFQPHHELRPARGRKLAHILDGFDVVAVGCQNLRQALLLAPQHVPAPGIDDTGAELRVAFHGAAHQAPACPEGGHKPRLAESREPLPPEIHDIIPRLVQRMGHAPDETLQGPGAWIKGHARMS